MIKEIIKNIFNSLGYDIKKINRSNQNLDFDEILEKNISKDAVIFDVGSNHGQSIERFSKLFNNPTIHAFEPVSEELNKLKDKYQNKKNIYLNNFALGEKEEIKKFNITQLTGNSSFNNINLGTNWLKFRSKQYNVKEKDYIKNIEKVKIRTLDNYVKENNIQKIDLLKIDTQGYEDKVLEGSIETIKNNKVSIVLTEIMFDNVYDKYFSFSDLEKFLIPNKFRMVGINLSNNNLFSGFVFFADVMYFNKKKFNI